MHIYINSHARDRAEERGTNKDEIIETVKQVNESKVKDNRLVREKVFAFAKEWNGKYHDEKRVIVIFTIESGNVVVIRVTVEYGKFSTSLGSIDILDLIA